MKVLVTGGAGFIGANFVLYWLKNHPEDEVVNLDKLTYAGNLENLTSAKNNPKHHFVRADICDSAAVNKAMAGTDTVVHFAAESHVDRSILDPSVFLETNVIGTQILLDAALKNNVKRFHHISTDEVFGTLELNTDSKFNETSPYNPHSPYAASKAGSDHIVRAYHDTYDLPITISNCSNNFGPYQFPEKLIPLAITNLLEGKKVPIYGDGLYVRDWLFVEDHCRAIDTILEKGIVGETYCVGSMTKDISNKDIVRKICQFMAINFNENVESVKDRPGHDRRYAIDFSKIQTKLGWEPRFDFDTALKHTIDWYSNNQDWWKHVKSGEYQKFYQQQYSS